MENLETRGERRTSVTEGSGFVSLHHARSVLRKMPDDRFTALDILPVHLFYISGPDERKQSITLPDMINILRSGIPVIQIATELRMPESTLRQYGAISLEFMRDKGLAKLEQSNL